MPDFAFTAAQRAQLEAALGRSARRAAILDATVTAATLEDHVAARLARAIGVLESGHRAFHEARAAAHRARPVPTPLSVQVVEHLRHAVRETFGPHTPLSVTEIPRGDGPPVAYDTPQALRAQLEAFAAVTAAAAALGRALPPQDAVPPAVGYGQTALTWRSGDEGRSLATWIAYTQELVENVRSGISDLARPTTKPRDEALWDLNRAIGYAVWEATGDVATKDIRAILRVLDSKAFGNVSPGRSSQDSLAKKIQQAAGEIVLPPSPPNTPARRLRDVAPALRGAGP